MTTTTLGDSWAKPLVRSMADCPKPHLHTKAPRGYLAWVAWADKKDRRHYQVRCPACGFLAIWRRKPAGAP